MTSLAVEWATMTVPEFVGWTRLAEVSLPFPLNTGALAYTAVPERYELDRALAEHKLLDSPVLAAVRETFAAPRLSVYAVRVLPDGTESKYVAMAGHGEQAVVVLLESTQVAVREIADTELAASVVAALPVLPALHVPSVEISLRELVEIDAAIEAGASARTLSAQMGQAGLPPSLIALRQRSSAGMATGGALGAVGHDQDGTGRHSRRSASWREFADGALLQIERGERQGETRILLSPYTPDAVFRAAVDAIASLYETGQV
ncbi:MAG TPA: ESX secretion-associated protein EspG [Jatrophihabitantaceae bacterium]|nr:ESX secretion-associated protein EspG [Jatrophihabitantaceae bacterium]